MAVIGATQIEPVNFLEEYARGLQIGAGRRALERQEVERIKAAQQEDEFRNYLAAADLASPDIQNQLIRRFGAKGAAIANSLGEMESAKLNRKKIESDIARQDRETELDGLNKAFRFVTGALEDPTTYPAAYQQALQFIPAEKLAAMGITEQYDPKALKSVANSLVSAAERIDAELRGRAVKVQERQIGLAEKKQKFEESQANQPSADDLVVARTETAADGTVRMYNKFGKLLKTEKGAGKPSGAFERAKATRETTSRDLSSALSTLKEVVKPGGLIEQSTGSLFGKGVDIAARTIGKATQGDIAIGKLQVLSDQILKLVPRFEGPQSDKDTQTYREAAGQLADGTLPNEIRKAAAETLIDLYTKRQNQFTISGAEAQLSGDWADL